MSQTERLEHRKVLFYRTTVRRGPLSSGSHSSQLSRLYSTVLQSSQRGFNNFRSGHASNFETYSHSGAGFSIQNRWSTKSTILCIVSQPSFHGRQGKASGLLRHCLGWPGKEQLISYFQNLFFSEDAYSAWSPCVLCNSFRIAVTDFGKRYT